MSDDVKGTTFKKNPRQIEATRLLGDSSKTRIMLYGGSRSGKTFMFVYSTLVRAIKHSNSRHLILRYRFAHAKAAICFDTIPKVIDLCFPALKWQMKLNKQDWFYTLANGSEIWIGGLDDGERVDKILGREYVTIYFNEASEISYQAQKVALTRLAQLVDGCVNKAYYDCNPPNKRHWLYFVFVLGLDYETKAPLHMPQRYGFMQMNAHDNADNIALGYIEETLEGMNGRERKRFLDGEFTDDAEGALWRSAWIADNRILLPHYDRNLFSEVVISVDPAMSSLAHSDATGIVVIGKIRNSDEAGVIEDLTMERATPAQWAMGTIDAYHKYKATMVIGEINQGGDLVKMNILHADASVPFSPVRATHGKALRAEPVAQMSERGKLKFYGDFPQLEDELTSWSPLSGMKSPNRLDAMVHGVVKVMRWGKKVCTW